MVNEAQQHAAEDHQRRQIAEAHNKLDNLVYTTEKTLKDNAGALDEASRKSIEDALAAARQKLDSKDLDEINRATESLMAASHKLAETMYSKTRQGAAQGGPAAADGGAAGAGQASDGQASDGQAGDEKKEDVVDADFKEVK
jgi:molecular chaperone DnaK